MSAMEIAEGSMSLMAEENKSEETMAQVSVMETAEGSMSRIADENKSEETMAQVSVMERDEGSMSRMAGENKSEETMARVSVLQQLVDRISSPPISELLGKMKLNEWSLNTLKSNLQSLDAILDDAESKAYEKKELKRWLDLQSHDPILDDAESKAYEKEEFERWLDLQSHESILDDAESKAYERWLDDLKEVGYDLEDLLAEIATERLRHQFESKPWNIKTRVRRIISANIIDRDIEDRLEEISSRIKRLLETGKTVLCLSEASRILSKPYPLSAAKDRTGDKCQVYGRNKDKKAIIKLLLSDPVTDDIITVLPIVGKGGVGKTTLARLVYNDDRVCKHFDLKGWAHVPDVILDDHWFIKAFSEAFNIEGSRNIGDKLNKILHMKKFLLVLDGLPVKVFGDLTRICDYLVAGAKGSKIILTAQSFNEKIAGAHPAYHLKPLKSDDSWMLFVKHAFADKETSLRPGLETIGKLIVAKCDGLPSVIVRLGAMLRFMPSAEEWEAVKRKLSDLHIEEDISPILLMSYNSLPLHLKRCFAYCSIFSDDHEYDKEKLVLLWMAEGFLQHSKHRRIEEVGHEYFDDLTSRSFFQKSGRNRSRFVMHPLVHKLAQFVSREFSFRFVNAPNDLPSGRVRHLSLSKKSYSQLFYCNTSQLRTLLLSSLPPGESLINSSFFLEIQAKNWQCLRVLSFSHDTIAKLPDSIGVLKLLQYLDLSHTKITRLPNSVTTLYNLQTLLLSDCHLLSKLPKKFRKLVYLRHLDIRETCLEEMPAKMGCLRSLQCLSDFVVGKHSGSNIRELGPLKNLRGTLRISKLQNVVSAKDAAEANLKNKADLQVLELKWSDATANSQHSTNVLEKLEPHQNLEKLSIISYNGMSFPEWVGDSSFSKMVFLRLRDCNSCSQLPPLGQLPSLKELIIEGMRGVKKIGPEFFRMKNVSANPFPSLKILIFQRMPEWEGWDASEMQPVEFQRLRRMCIKSCPKYENHSYLRLPPSAEVEISVTEEILPDEPFIVEKQLQEGNKVHVREKEKLQDRPPPGTHQRLAEDIKRKIVSTMEMVEESTSLMSQQLFGKISSHIISEFFGERKLNVGLLNNLKRDLLILDAILRDAELIAYKDEKVKDWFGEEVIDWFGDLREVSYDLNVLLDKIAYHQFKFKLENIITWVQKIISPNIRDIRDRLEEINSRIKRLLDTGKGACLTEDSSAKHVVASENFSAATEIPSDTDIDDPIDAEGDKVQFRKNEKLQRRPSTPPEESQLPDSNVVQIIELSITSNSPPQEFPQRLTEDSSAKHGGASETSSAPTEIPSDTDTDDPINAEGDKVKFRRNEKLLDVPSTSRPPEESQLADCNVVQRTEVSIKSNSPPQEFPQHLTEDSSAKHGWASGNSSAATEFLSDTDCSKDSQEDISSPEKESLNVNNGGASSNLSAIETSSDTDYSEDSQGDISSPEQESMKVSQISQLESLPQKLYSLEIEACESLESLPAHLNMLNNLQHLYIINCHLLKSIQASHLPEALKSLYISKCKEVQFLTTAEKHKFLENLCIESSCDSLESFPLAIFPQLRSLSIWDCAKFNSLSITEAHMFLDALEIRNCAQFRSFPEEELCIPNLTSILLSNCKSLKALPGQLHGLTCLQALFINECPEVESVPEGGLPSSLNLVCIRFCHKLTPCIEWGLHKLNDFSRIEIEDGSKDLESFPEQNLLPRNLISLQISRLPNLKVLDYKGLQHLTTLETLKINSCNKLHSLPDEGLPSSLSYLCISDCPLLISELQNRRGKEWLKIAHIPHIQIDGNVIS